jgi:hypothetical protein
MAGLVANKAAAEYNIAVEEVHLARPRAQGCAMADRTDGGWWFCGKIDQFLIYEEEFDTYVHVDCIRKALADEEKIGEKTGKKAAKARQMAYLLGDGI